MYCWLCNCARLLESALLKGACRLSAVEGAEVGVGEDGVEGPDPAVGVVPDGIVYVGDEVVDVPGVTDGAGFVR